MQIKKIEIKHLESLYQISKQQFKSESWTKEQFFDSLKDDNYLCFGCFEDDKLLSYILALSSIDDINVLSVATLNDYKNKGLAKSLLKKIIEIANNGFKSVSLEVKSKNTIAKQLYNGIGFKEIYKRNKYYKDNDDAIIMFLNSNNI